MPHINVVTLKTGDFYTAEYVNKLYSSLSRNLELPFEMWVITDNTDGLCEDISVIQPSEFYSGWWSKLLFFSDLMPEGPLLCLDLDQIFLDDLTDIINEALKYPFSCFSDHIHWHGERFGSSFMVFNSGSLNAVYERFKEERPDLIDYEGGDQVWIARTGLIPDVFYLDDVFPGAFRSYKFDKLSKAIPDGTRIANFNGFPKPHHLRTPLILEHWR